MCLYVCAFLQLISAVVNKNWTELARQGSLENWRELLAALVTYAGPEEFAPLCGESVSCSQEDIWSQSSCGVLGEKLFKIRLSTTVFPRIVPMQTFFFSSP